jgi:enolase-phosphatase E1
VTIRLVEPYRAVLLDIEGTTTTIDFVYEVLFPFARTHLRAFLREHNGDNDLLKDIAALRAEHASDVSRGASPPPLAASGACESIAEYVEWLMDQDRKSTPLKSLQGRIWKEGYSRGELHSEVFDDVPRAFERWSSQQRQIYIYSSGSILAQKLLFERTNDGDLTTLIKGYFDTTVGRKTEGESYKRIASSIGLRPVEVAFFSDVVAELEAARDAGMQAVLCDRPGNRPQPASNFESIKSFDELDNS